MPEQLYFELCYCGRPVRISSREVMSEHGLVPLDVCEKRIGPILNHDYKHVCECGTPIPALSKGAKAVHRCVPIDVFKKLANKAKYVN